MNSPRKEIEMGLNEEELLSDDFRYLNLDVPTSPSDNLMKTKLNNLFSNLSYFDQEGKKIIRRNA